MSVNMFSMSVRTDSINILKRQPSFLVHTWYWCVIWRKSYEPFLQTYYPHDLKNNAKCFSMKAHRRMNQFQKSPPGAVLKLQSSLAIFVHVPMGNAILAKLNQSIRFQYFYMKWDIRNSHHGNKNWKHCGQNLISLWPSKTTPCWGISEK